MSSKHRLIRTKFFHINLVCQNTFIRGAIFRAILQIANFFSYSENAILHDSPNIVLHLTSQLTWSKFRVQKIGLHFIIHLLFYITTYQNKALYGE